MEVERPATRSRNEGTGVTGPSFLGLSDASDDGDDDGHYRPYGDDLYRANWGARFLFALIVIGVVGGLGYVQLKSNHPLQAILGMQQAANANGQQNGSAPPANASTPAGTSDNQNTAATANGNGASTNSSPSAESSDTAETAMKDGAGDQDEGSSKGKTASANLSKDKDASSGEKNNSSSGDKQASDANGKQASTTAAVSDARQQSTKGKSKSAKAKSSSDEEDATNSDETSDENDTSTAAAPARAVDNSEEPVRQAEIYLEGKGVPQNCDEGVGILRAAEARGNTRALVKLGAIYATGNCVPKDNAIAYHYFTKAHALDPKNEWVEENRAILWANMTEDERARARAEDGSVQ